MALVGWLTLKDSARAPIQSVEIDGVGYEPITGSGTYVLNSTESMLKAQGKKPLVVGYTDIGGISFKSGEIIVSDGRISGTITVDMNSITVESTGNGGGEPMLQKHLKSSDFFDVENYPESLFRITETKLTGEDSLYMVTGNLTIKDITKPITFPAVIRMKDGKMITEGSVSIDRTLWGIKYGSGSFFSDLGDKVISDLFLAEFKISADLK